VSLWLALALPLCRRRIRVPAILGLPKKWLYWSAVAAVAIFWGVLGLVSHTTEEFPNRAALFVVAAWIALPLLVVCFLAILVGGSLHKLWRVLKSRPAS
jgi:hypothetical protein